MDFNEARAYVLLPGRTIPAVMGKANRSWARTSMGKYTMPTIVSKAESPCMWRLITARLHIFLEESRTTQPTQPRKHGNIDFPRREGWIMLIEYRWNVVLCGGLAADPVALGASVGKP